MGELGWVGDRWLGLGGRDGSIVGGGRVAWGARLRRLARVWRRLGQGEGLGWRGDEGDGGLGVPTGDGDWCLGAGG